MAWFYLALLAPLLWSVVILIDDNLVRSVYKGPYFGSMVSGLFGALPLVSLLWLNLSPITPWLALVGVGAGFFTVLYYFYYFKALEREAPSVVIAIFSLTPITLLFLAHLFLGESLTSKQLLGFTIVLIASFILATTDVRKFKFTKALSAILIAAILYDISAVASKYIYERTDFYTGYMFFCTGMALGGLYYLYSLLFLGKGKAVQEMFRKNGLRLILILAAAEFINIAAEFVQKLAISRGPVSLVKALENVQPIYLLLIALGLYPLFPQYFREAREGRVMPKLLLMTVILFGVIMTVL